MNETNFDKKVRLLLEEGKVKITDIGQRFIWAEVEGDTSTYILSYDRKKYKWTCSCKGKSNFRLDEDIYCTHMEAADIFRVRRGLR